MRLCRFFNILMCVLFFVILVVCMCEFCLFLLCVLLYVCVLLLFVLVFA